jgi:hypothetical protein
MADDKLAKIPQLPRGAQLLQLPQAAQYISPYAVRTPGGPHPVADIDNISWFPALQPITPMAPRDTPIRTYEYPPGVNVVWEPKAEQEGSVPFPILRSFADSWDLLRVAIETVKDRLCDLEWQIRLKRLPGEKNAQYEKRSQSDKRISAVTKFFEKPDGVRPWKNWLRLILEDMLVCDNASIAIVRDKRNRISGLRAINGDTINRVLNDAGETPGPGETAYQQVLYGIAAIDLTTDDLLYAMRNGRTWKRYGYPPVQQIINFIALGLRRLKFQNEEYASGNIPEALCFLPQDMPVQRVAQIQAWFDSQFAGDLAKRRRLTFLPGYGTAKEGGRNNVQFTKEALIKDTVDDWLWQVVAYCLSVPSQALLKPMNRASAEENADTAQAEGEGPKIDWIAGVCNEIIQNDRRFGYDDLEWAPADRRDVDIEKQANVDKTYLSVGVKTINEVRGNLGLDPFTYPEADEPGAFTQNGFIPLTAGVVNQPGAVGSAAGKAGAALVGNMQDHEQAQQDRADEKFKMQQSQPALPAPGQPQLPAAKPPGKGKGKTKKAEEVFADMMAKIYDSVSEVPSYVPKSKRRQWMAVWNSAYNRYLEDIDDPTDQDRKDAEQSAFAQANGVAGPNSNGHSKAHCPTHIFHADECLECAHAELARMQRAERVVDIIATRY